MQRNLEGSTRKLWLELYNGGAKKTSVFKLTTKQRNSSHICWSGFGAVTEANPRATPYADHEPRGG